MAKKLLIATFFLSLIAFFFFYFLAQPKLDPASSQNQFYSQLKHALSIANLKAVSFSYQHFQNQVKFYLPDTQTQVTLSTQKDAYWQISILQQTIKEAKIKHKTTQFIDLSAHRPYATIKNS